MICPKCNSNIKDGSSFCSKCGNELKETETQSNVKTPQIRTVINWVYLLLVLAEISIFIPVYKYLGHITGILLAILLVICFTRCFRKVCDAKCPYCNKNIVVPANCQALDCPICKERIVIDSETKELQKIDK